MVRTAAKVAAAAAAKADKAAANDKNLKRDRNPAEDEDEQGDTTADGAGETKTPKAKKPKSRFKQTSQRHRLRPLGADCTGRTTNKLTTQVMNDMVMDFLDQLAANSKTCANRGKHRLNWNIDTARAAVKLTLPPEFAKGAIQHAISDLAKFQAEDAQRAEEREERKAKAKAAATG